MQDSEENFNLYCNGIGLGSFGGTTGEFLQKEGRERDKGGERQKRDGREQTEVKILIQSLVNPYCQR